MKSLVLFVLVSLSTAAQANIVEIDQNIVSNKCAKRLVAKIEKNPVVNVYLSEEDESVSMEFGEDGEKTIYCTIDVIGDPRAGYTIAEFAVKMLPNGDCKVGRLVNWDSAF